MMKRLAVLCFMAMLLVGFNSPSIPAQSDAYSNGSLKGISSVYVVVEELDDDAKIIGLTEGAIQTDIELKLRLAGMRVVSEKEGMQLSGSPHIYVRAALAPSAKAACVEVGMEQNVLLQRTRECLPGVKTWETGGTILNPTAQGIRNHIKDQVDIFLNAWRSVNPKK
jgi:hypothetical protein